MDILMLLSDGPGAPGGIARYNSDLLDALRTSPDIGTITVLCRHDDQAGMPGGTIERQASRLRYVWRAWQLARRLPADGLIFCGHLHIAPLALWLSRLCGRRYWLQLHGIDAWGRPSRWRERACESASLVTAVSRYTRRRFLQWSALPGAALRVLPNTVSASFCVDAAPRNASCFTLLTVGRLAASEAYKGQDRVITALPALIDKLGPCRYRIVGTGDDQPRLQALAQRHGVADSVEFCGSVSAADLPSLYQSADVFVMPSTGEGFGIAFLEAMASGVPAVGFGVDGSVDPLVDGELGTVATADTLVEQIIATRQRPRGEALSQATVARFGRVAFDAHVHALCAQLPLLLQSMRGA